MCYTFCLFGLFKKIEEKKENHNLIAYTQDTTKKKKQRNTAF